MLGSQDEPGTEDIAKMYMLQCVVGEVSPRDNIRNEHIKASVGMVIIREEMREHRLWLLGPVIRPGDEDVVRAVLGLRVEVRRGRDKRNMT